MPASPARIAANQANALKSTGPKTPEGKERSRANSLQHGLTGEGVVVPAEDAAEVERLSRCFEAELKPSGDVGRVLVRRMALMSVRMDRLVAQESAALAERVRRAEAEFDADWPAEDGEEDQARGRMRAEAGRLALFDPSKEATLARKYESAAERSFFRALKELRQVEKAAKAGRLDAEPDEARAALGSFLKEAAATSKLVLEAARTPRKAEAAPSKPVAPAPIRRPDPASRLPVAPPAPLGGAFDLPFSIGRAR